MTGLGRAVGLVVGYAGVALALRMADAVDGMLVESARQAAEHARLCAELDEDQAAEDGSA